MSTVGEVCQVIVSFCIINPKTSIFENGQFSGHFFFDKNNFLGEKKFFYPDKQELIFLKKTIFLFFLIFLKNNLKKNISKKTFKKKNGFFKKKKNVFFKKAKFLFIGVKNIFFSQNEIIFVKTKVSVNCPFLKMEGFGFALQIQELNELPPTHTVISHFKRKH